MELSPAAAPLEARFQLNEADNKVFQKLAQKGTTAPTVQRVIRSMLALFALLLVASIVFRRTLANNAATPVARVGASGTVNFDNVFALLIPIGLFMVIWGFLMLSGRNARAKNPMFNEPTLMTLDSSALTRRCGAFFNRIEWHGIVRVITSETHLILMPSPTEGFIVPRRAFGNDADWQRFVDFASQQWQRDRPATPPIASV